jgi:hypothetical protein
MLGDGSTGPASRGRRPVLTSSRSREGVSSLKDEETIFLRERSHFLKPRRLPETEIRSNRSRSNNAGLDHVEHHYRPDLLVHNRAGLAVNLMRRGQGPGSEVPEEFASGHVADAQSSWRWRHRPG